MSSALKARPDTARERRSELSLGPEPNGAARLSLAEYQHTGFTSIVTKDAETWQIPTFSRFGPGTSGAYERTFVVISRCDVLHSRVCHSGTIRCPKSV